MNDDSNIDEDTRIHIEMFNAKVKGMSNEEFLEYAAELVAEEEEI
jgi:hypothetical protein